MPTRVFVFDLFGVVISFDDRIVYRRLAEYCSNPEVALRGMHDLVSTPELIRGQLSLDSLHQQLCASHGLALTLDQFDALWRKPYSQSMIGMDSVLETLKARYRLVLLSNIDPYYWRTVKALHPELRHFDELLLSCDLGLSKPDPRVFAHAAQAARAEPAECFFVDDKAENVEAARARGFQAHLFEGVPSLQAALQRAGVLGF